MTFIKLNYRDCIYININPLEDFIPLGGRLMVDELSWVKYPRRSQSYVDIVLLM